MNGIKFEERVERLARSRYDNWEELDAKEINNRLSEAREDLGFGIGGCGLEGFPCHRVEVILADAKNACGVVVRNTDKAGDHRWPEGLLFPLDAEQLALSIEVATECVTNHVKALESE